MCFSPLSYRRKFPTELAHGGILLVMVTERLPVLLLASEKYYPWCKIDDMVPKHGAAVGPAKFPYERYTDTNQGVSPYSLKSTVLPQGIVLVPGKKYPETGIKKI